MSLGYVPRPPFTSDVAPTDTTRMAPILRFKYIDLDSKKLTVSLFRQLPIVRLCNDQGAQDKSIAPIGTVRYKHEGISAWALALQGARAVRCPLNLELEPRKALEEKLSFWSESARQPHNLPRGKDSIAHRQAEQYRLAIEAEPLRHAAHCDVAKLEQIFL